MVDRGPLPPEAIALLETISDTESINDVYNVIYGGSRFDDYSDHPRKYVLIQSGPNKGKYSSAAGKYQFLSSTWDDVAGELGLTDFSPESQDVAAWHLAQRDYKNATGGELLAVLRSGSPDLINKAGRILSKTWTSLPSGIEQGQGSSQFLKAFNNHLKAAGARDEGTTPIPGVRPTYPGNNFWSPRPADMPADLRTRNETRLPELAPATPFNPPTNTLRWDGEKLVTANPAVTAIEAATGGGARDGGMSYAGQDRMSPLQSALAKLRGTRNAGDRLAMDPVRGAMPGADANVGLGLRSEPASRIDQFLPTTAAASIPSNQLMAEVTALTGGNGSDRFMGTTGTDDLRRYGPREVAIPHDVVPESVKRDLARLRGVDGQMSYAGQDRDIVPQYITKTIREAVPVSQTVRGPQDIPLGEMNYGSRSRDSLAQAELGREVASRATFNVPEVEYVERTIQVPNPDYVAPKAPAGPVGSTPAVPRVGGGTVAAGGPPPNFIGRLGQRIQQSPLGQIVSALTGNSQRQASQPNPIVQALMFGNGGRLADPAARQMFYGDVNPSNHNAQAIAALLAGRGSYSPTSGASAGGLMPTTAINGRIRNTYGDY